MPNAGLPQFANGRFLYLASPDYFADYAIRLKAAGARLIGGCCGTTPAHIRRMREPRARPGTAAAEAADLDGASAPPPVPPAPQIVIKEPAAGDPASRSLLARKRPDHEFVVSRQADPPRGARP